MTMISYNSFSVISSYVSMNDDEKVDSKNLRRREKKQHYFDQYTLCNLSPTRLICSLKGNELA